MRYIVTNETCERCGTELKGRILSWFNLETICLEKCWEQEQEIKLNLPNHGRNHEGCGFTPELEIIKL